MPQWSFAASAPNREIVAALDLRIPSETVAPDGLYPQRAPELREALIEQGGGDERTEAAVARALEWLARHQSDDGRWSGKRFDDGCGRCDSPARFEFDRAITGLALLCFLGADHTHTKPGPYQDAVKRGIVWLVQSQGEDGDLRQGETMYSHGIATIALAEAYGMTNDSELFEPLARAVEFIAAARHPSSGGWRYDPRQPGDTSVLGWQIMAAESARRSGVPVPAEVFEGAGRWLDRASSTRRPGLYAYQPGQPPTPSMTAEGMFVQQLLGFDRDDRRMSESAAYLLDHLPGQHADGVGAQGRSGEDDEAPTYYWYYATLALYQHGGEAWAAWNSALVPRLLDRQRSGSGPVSGSWDPEDEWADIGGRVYQTAMCTMMLEIYYRYLPVYIDADRRAARADSAGQR